MALSVSLRAFGDHLRLPILIVVITLAAIIGGISPSPGGMGVVEAGMILGLTAAGVSEADATAAVFIQRLFTSYLPPIWGWITLVWMRQGSTCDEGGGRSDRGRNDSPPGRAHVPRRMRQDRSRRRGGAGT